MADREITPNERGSVSCKHFGRCGGCDFLNVPYAEELRDKQAWLEDMLGELIDGDEPIDLFPAPRPLLYRSKLKAPFANTNEGTAIAGFYKRDSHQIVNLRECRIQEPLLTELLIRTRLLAKEFSVRAYSERTERGLLRYFVARQSVSGEALVGLVVRRSGEKKIRQLASRLFEEFRDRGLVGVLENHNPRVGNRILGRKSRTLEGVDQVRETWRGLDLRTGLHSFTQPHRSQADALYDLVLGELGEVEGRRVADVYAGWAPMGMLLASRGAQVIAIESETRAVADAKANAERNHLLDRMEFVGAEAETVLGEIDVDAAILDPPRRGLDPAAIAALNRRPIKQLVYVSCHPPALHQDLQQLKASYRVATVQAVDMFPRTQQVEAVATLEARPAT